MFPSRNPLLFPVGRKPGFNPQHIAATGILNGSPAGQTSGVVSVCGSGFTNLITGMAPSVNGSPTPSSMSCVGPGVSFLNSGDSLDFNYVLGGGGVVPAVTYGAIVVFVAVGSGYQGIIEHSTASSLDFLSLSTTQFNVYVAGDNLSGLTPTAGVPYFVGVSLLSGSTINWAITNLQTGNIFTSTAAVTTLASQGGGGLRIGNNNLSGQQANGLIAAAMFSQKFLTLPQLVSWARDPWSFWYPRMNRSLVGVAAVGGFKPYWAANTNLPVLGTGTY